MITLLLWISVVTFLISFVMAVLSSGADASRPVPMVSGISILFYIAFLLSGGSMVAFLILWIITMSWS